MRRGGDPSSGKAKSELGGYVFTWLILLALGALMIFGIWRSLHLDGGSYHAQSGPIGFGPGWDCVGAGTKGGGFCIRTPPVPPSKRESRSLLQKASRP